MKYSLTWSGKVGGLSLWLTTLPLTLTLREYLRMQRHRGAV